MTDPTSDVAPVSVRDVACSQCRAEPGRDCIGDGEGYHLNRWDRATDVNEEADRG